MADSDFFTCHSSFNASFFVVAMAYYNGFSIVSKVLCFFFLAIVSDRIKNVVAPYSHQ